jgi:type IV pilus assembly protein PilO
MKLSTDTVLKLPTSKKILILVILLCVVTGVYFFLFFMPRSEELRMQKEELSKQIKELNEAKAITQDLEKFKRQIAQLNEELKIALTHLPNEKEIPEILKNISSLGRESNLEFTLFRPKPEEPQQFYAKVPIELTVLGSYHDTGTFFDRVGKLPRIINVVDFNMTRREPKSKETEVVVRTSCLLNTYRFIDQKSEEKKSEKKTASK